ncbi:Type-4 uracil-DNA glycosylase [Porphyridium purpureum]|uniref:Type-4 uracil-DNA glycosylase n=1 Tax=Porphyridium purpureum TaxID=35688 RepID=A0A5J4YQC1_PORPP|nr:Type-4 uracil-DNA glycosylase [Porphyridium purpureum]|eukprot:POR2980..scf295_9
MPEKAREIHPADLLERPEDVIADTTTLSQARMRHVMVHLNDNWCSRGAVGWCVAPPFVLFSRTSCPPPAARNVLGTATASSSRRTRTRRVVCMAWDDIHSLGDLERAYREHVDNQGAVMFRGNPRASVMVIGEGPAKDESGIDGPLLGRAGQLLDRALRSAGLSEENVYITNLIKYRKRDADPTEETLEYNQLLRLELSLIDPDVVILCGRAVKEALLPTEKRGITAIRGNWYDIREENSGRRRWFFPVFHPSYLLRNPRWTSTSPKAQTWYDMQAIKEKLADLPLR